VGYDDVKYGGAFEVLNSCGTDWSNNGYMDSVYPRKNYFKKNAAMGKLQNGV
jgi:C1A family cysteine protease